MDNGEKKKLKPTIMSSLIYTKPNRKNKKRATPTSSRRRQMARWLHTKLGRRRSGVGTNPFGCPRKSSST
jgi:hypothetical protein